MLSRQIPKDHGPAYMARTSGSTGEPIQIMLSGLHQSIYKAMNLRNYLWHGLDLKARIAAIRRTEPGIAEPPDGRRERGYWAASHATGSAAQLNITASVPDQIAWLARQAPDYLLSFPTNLRALALRCEERGLRLPSLRAVSSYGEVLGSEVRGICRRVWGTPVIDSYSANEIGMIALQCPQHTHYHVMAEGVMVEILDEHDRPCPPGGIGRVVLTVLHNFAMPLIRYATGDYAQVGEPCSCNRGLPVLERILGRRRDMILLPSGERRWMDLPSADVAAIEPLRQWQIVQRSREEMEVKLVVSRPLSHEEQSRFTASLRKAFAHPLEFTFNYVDAIPREVSGKHADFRCDIESPGG